MTWAEQEVPSGIAALVVATVPLWMALIDWLFAGGRRPGGQTAIGKEGQEPLAALPPQLTGPAREPDNLAA